MASFPSSDGGVSRWTPAIFACAYVNLVIGQLLLVAGVSWPAAPAMSGATLATVHLLTIGWITLLMFGAMFQFVPVLTGQRLWSQALSLVALLLVESGLAGMVAGFFLLGTPWALLLPVGGSLAILGMMAGGLNLAIPLGRGRLLSLSARFIIAGQLLLLLTVVLGLSFALAFAVPALAAAVAPIVAGGVEYHVLAGVGGWFTLTAIGVSYELLPMFMLAPHNRGAWGSAVFWAAVAGFAAALGAGLTAPWLAGDFIAAVEQAGRAAITLAGVLYLIDVGRMYRDRRRRRIELHNRVAIGAFAALGIALALSVAFGIMGDLGSVAPTIVFLLIFGWLSGLGLSQLYKIVAFLAWLSHFGSRLGTGPVPRVQDLVNERVAARMFVAYFIAIAFAAGGAFFGLALLVRAAMAVALAATALLGREYWRAWRSHYVRHGAPATVPRLPAHIRPGHDHARATHA